jgi:hypothetical protein
MSTAEPDFLNFKEPKNRFQGTATPISTRNLAPKDCLNIPALYKGAQINFEDLTPYSTFGQA